MIPMEELREQAAKIARRTGEAEAGGLRDASYKRGIQWATDRIVEALAATPLPAPVALPQAGEVEQIKRENREYMGKALVEFAGPVVSFEVNPPYYLASCDACGWVGSSEQCGLDTGMDDSDVYCPRCHASGADCGKVANYLVPTPTETPAAAAPDDAILRKAQEIVGIANGYQGSDGPNAIIPITVLRAAAMIVNGVALAPMLAKAAAPDDGLMGRYREALRKIVAWNCITDDIDDPVMIAREALSTATGDEGGK